MIKVVLTKGQRMLAFVSARFMEFKAATKKNITDMIIAFIEENARPNNNKTKGKG